MFEYYSFRGKTSTQPLQVYPIYLGKRRQVRIFYRSYLYLWGEGEDGERKTREYFFNIYLEMQRKRLRPVLFSRTLCPLVGIMILITSYTILDLPGTEATFRISLEFPSFYRPTFLSAQVDFEFSIYHICEHFIPSICYNLPLLSLIISNRYQR